MNDIMETIGNYPDLAAAKLAQSILEAEGIETAIPDEYLTGVDWQLSTAVHGVRLLVHADDVEAAKTLLASGEHEEFAEETESEPVERCRSCGSDNIGPAPWKRRVKGLTLLVWPLLLVYPLLALVLPTKACLACGKAWRTRNTYSR